MVRIARADGQVPTHLLYYDFAGLVPTLGNAEIILSQSPDALKRT